MAPRPWWAAPVAPAFARAAAGAPAALAHLARALRAGDKNGLPGAAGLAARGGRFAACAFSGAPFALVLRPRVDHTVEYQMAAHAVLRAMRAAAAAAAAARGRAGGGAAFSALAVATAPGAAPFLGWLAQRLGAAANVAIVGEAENAQKGAAAAVWLRRGGTLRAALAQQWPAGVRAARAVAAVRDALAALAAACGAYAAAHRGTYHGALARRVADELFGMRARLG